MTTGWRESAATFKKGFAGKIAFILLNQADLTLTLVAVSMGLTEVNPLVRHLMAMPALLLVVKLLIPIVLAWLVPVRLLLPGIVLMGGVVIWNIQQILSALF